MSIVSKAVGEKIRIYRKKKHMTLAELAECICKSKATVSKYEAGEITVDLDTLYELADALNVNVNQLLYTAPPKIKERNDTEYAFFRNISHFYGYIYDGRENKVIHCFFELSPRSEDQHQAVRMYMNFSDYDCFQLCENTYEGFIEHFDAITNIILTNEYLPMEKASIQLLVSSLDAAVRMGLWNGLSTRPLMPIATKIMLSRKQLAESDEMISQLKISANDIKLFKLYNMFPVL